MNLDEVAREMEQYLDELDGAVEDDGTDRNKMTDRRAFAKTQFFQLIRKKEVTHEQFEFFISRYEIEDYDLSKFIAKFLKDWTMEDLIQAGIVEQAVLTADLEKDNMWASTHYNFLLNLIVDVETEDLERDFAMLMGHLDTSEKLESCPHAKLKVLLEFIEARLCPKYFNGFGESMVKDENMAILEKYNWDVFQMLMDKIRKDITDWPQDPEMLTQERILKNTLELMPLINSDLLLRVFSEYELSLEEQLNITLWTTVSTNYYYKKDMPKLLDVLEDIMENMGSKDWVKSILKKIMLEETSAYNEFVTKARVSRMFRDGKRSRRLFHKYIPIPTEEDSEYRYFYSMLTYSLAKMMRVEEEITLKMMKNLFRYERWTPFRHALECNPKYPETYPSLQEYLFLSSHRYDEPLDDMTDKELALYYFNERSKTSAYAEFMTWEMANSPSLLDNYTGCPHQIAAILRQMNLKNIGYDTMFQKLEKYAAHPKVKAREETYYFYHSGEAARRVDFSFLSRETIEQIPIHIFKDYALMSSMVGVEIYENLDYKTIKRLAKYNRVIYPDRDYGVRYRLYDQIAENNNLTDEERIDLILDLGELGQEMGYARDMVFDGLDHHNMTVKQFLKQQRERRGK